MLRPEKFTRTERIKRLTQIAEMMKIFIDVESDDNYKALNNELIDANISLLEAYTKEATKILTTLKGE